MNFYGKIAELFIRNKQLSFLLLFSVLLWGMISFWIMPKQYNPEIVAPAFSIEVAFPGATAEEVHQIVTRPLQNVVQEIPGVETIYSRSFPGGRSSVVVEFYVGEDLERSMITLRQRLASRINLAPLGAGEPFIASIDPEDLPVKTLALYSDQVSPVMLRKKAFQLKDALHLVKGTSYIEVLGGKKREFQILLSPEKMVETKTSLSEIQQALGNTSLLKDLGLIKTHENYYRIETGELAKTTRDIEDIVIISNVERQLRIGDVAEVLEGEKEETSSVAFDKEGNTWQEMVYLAISKRKGANIMEVCRGIDEKVAALSGRSELLKDIVVESVRDEGRIARKEISGLVLNLGEAILIVFAVLFLFLNPRAAFIVAFSIPMTLLFVMAVGNLFGYTINRITLFALILSLGLLVDSATVVIENIVKNKRLYPEKEQGLLVMESVSEVGTGLFLSTLTTVLAFVPMVFVTGMMGPYMGPLPFFVSAALVVSLLFAYTLNPWLASLLCEKKSVGEFEGVKFVARFMDQITLFYQRLLAHLLRAHSSRRLFLLGAVLALGVAMIFPVIGWVPFRLLPKADREQIYLYLDLDRGRSLEYTRGVSREFIQHLLQQPEVRSIQSYIGTPPVLDFNGLFRGVSARRNSNQATLKMNLTAPGKRNVSSEILANHYRESLGALLTKFPEARVQVVEDPPGPPVQATFWVKVKSENPALLEHVTRDLEQKVRKISGIVDVDSSIAEPLKKYVLSVDKREAARSKVSVESISAELETVFSGRVIGVYHSDYHDEQEYIVLKFDRDFRDEVSDLEKIFVVNALGNHVPLARFVRVKEESDDPVIMDDNRERVAYISAEMAGRGVVYAAMDFLRQLWAYHVPGKRTERHGFSLLEATFDVEGERLKVEPHGEWEMTVKVFRDLGAAMVVAVVLIYLVLVAQFRSFLLPLLILATIPLALIGILPGFAILFKVMGVYFSATSMIGVIALAGIVVNNAIILMEYVAQAARQCSSLDEALLEAGRMRLRPILLTSITTVLGSLVIAADPVWSGLAWSVVCGLSLSAVLTLVVFPLLIQDFLGTKWFALLRTSA